MKIHIWRLLNYLWHRFGPAVLPLTKTQQSNLAALQKKWATEYVERNK